MSKPISGIRTYLVTTILCVVCALSWLSWKNQLRTKQFSQLLHTARSSNSSPQNPSKAKSTSSRFSNQESISNLAHDLAFLNLTELEKVAKTMRLSFQHDPEGTANWLKEVSLQMAHLGEHSQALELASFLFGIRQIPQIERTIIEHWMINNSTTLRKTLIDQAQDHLTDEHHLSILASIIQHEQSAELEAWISWIRAQEDQEQLRNQFMAKLMRHSHPASAPKLVELIGPTVLNSHTVNVLPQLAKQISPEKPEVGITWLASLDGSTPLKASALSLTLANLAIEEPEKVEAMMQPDHFLNHILGIHPESNGQWPSSYLNFYDLTLQETLKHLTHLNPTLQQSLSELVLTSKAK